MSDLPTRARSPIAAALLIQLVILLLLAALALLLARVAGIRPPLLWLALAQGLLAAMVSRGFGFTIPWVIGQLIAPPLLYAGRDLDLPGWLLPLVLVLLALTYWNVARYRVPLFLTNRRTIEALELLLPSGGGAFIDLGCGLGGPLRHLAARHPDMRFTGVETAPLPFALAWVLARLSGRDNLEICYRDLFSEDLAPFDVAYCFLSPAPMARLFAKAQAEMRPGSLFISNSFKVPDFPPDQVVTVEDRRGTKLLIWRM